jgi:hypothetical protein
MMLNRLLRPVAVSVLAVLALLSTTAVGPAVAQQAPTSTSQRLEDLPDSGKPIDHTSRDGHFRVTFPTGCARLLTRMNTGDRDSTKVDARLVFVTCDRANTKEEGCQVSARLGVARGLKGKAAADRVLAVVRKLLDGYGVAPAHQTAIRRDFGVHGVVEGIDIQAHPESGKGDVWIRGLIHGDDMYFLLAWKARGGMLDDPEYGEFFQSFQPWAE